MPIKIRLMLAIALLYAAASAPFWYFFDEDLGDDEGEPFPWERDERDQPIGHAAPPPIPVVAPPTIRRPASNLFS